MPLIREDSEESGLYWQDATGRVENKVIMIVAGIGGGKSLAKDQLSYEYRRMGGIWISLTDEKDKYEQCFMMFPPEEQWHLNTLSYEGRKIEPQDVIIWHPFTFDLPKGYHPNMRVFTIPITSIGREELSVITETDADTDAVKLFFDAMRKLKKTEGISDMLYYANEALTKKEKKLGKKTVAVPDPDNFFLPQRTSGSDKTISKLIGFFKPYVYQKPYIFAPESCELNLDVEKEIFKKQKYVHILETKYIKDRKIKDLVILWFMKNIIRNIDKTNHPILFDIEEVRAWLPKHSSGWKDFITKNIREDLSKIRSIGRGCSVVMTTQVLSDVHSCARDSISPNETYIGSLGNLKDIEKIGSTLRLKTEEIRLLASIDRNCFMRKDKQYNEIMRFLMPKFMHAEEKYNFLEMYERYNIMKPDKYPLILFDDVINIAKKFREEEFSRAQERAKKYDNDEELPIKKQIKFNPNKKEDDNYEDEGEYDINSDENDRDSSSGKDNSSSYEDSTEDQESSEEEAEEKIVDEDTKDLFKKLYKEGKSYKHIAIEYGFEENQVKQAINS